MQLNKVVLSNTALCIVIKLQRANVTKLGYKK